jgi:8-oxo-dGTP pyrophosphatase MutT (NUDIX family)
MGQLLQIAQKALIIRKDKKILVIKNFDDAKYNPGMIHFPGGRMKFGEGVDEHITREVMEETQVKVKPLEVLGITSWTVFAGEEVREEIKKDDLQVVAIIRKCKFISGNLNTKNNVDDEQIEKAMWVSPDELLKDKKFDKKLLPALKEYLRGIHK